MTGVLEGGGGGRTGDRRLSLYQLLDPEILANPYPLYRRLRDEAPVHWDPFLHAWVVTRYEDVSTVLHTFSANRTPTPEQLAALGMERVGPIAALMVRQMLFLDPPEHTRVRMLAAKAFTPRRVEVLRGHIAEIADRLLDDIEAAGSVEIIGDLARPLPAIVTAEMLGLPIEDWPQLTDWSRSFAEMLGNFQHNPGRAAQVVTTVEDMTAYFQRAIDEQRERPRDGLLHALMTAEVDGNRFSDEEVIANTIITMVGGQETTTNLIGNGMLSLLRNPGQWELLKSDPSLVTSAVEELLRYEAPSQHTARLAFEDTELGGQQIQKRQAVIAVMGAANRDPERFADPDRLDLSRPDNRHLAFGWSSHYCFGAPLARIEGQLVFEALARRLPTLHLDPDRKLTWRANLGLRGLDALPLEF
jgi:pimeloyl-[acyl-carrier protein] synthase